MRYIFMLAAALFVLAPTVPATAASSNAAAASTANAPTDQSAAKMRKSKRKSAGKVEYMRAVPSR
jgi:hypothetical protein